MYISTTQFLNWRCFFLKKKPFFFSKKIYCKNSHGGSPWPPPSGCTFWFASPWLWWRSPSAYQVRLHPRHWWSGSCRHTGTAFGPKATDGRNHGKLGLWSSKCFIIHIYIYFFNLPCNQHRLSQNGWENDFPFLLLYYLSVARDKFKILEAQHVLGMILNQMLD